MFDLLKRLVAAVESIAKDMREMREEQKSLVELSRREAVNGPQRVVEIFSQLKKLGGEIR